MDASALAQRGQALREQKRYAEAEEVYRQVVALAPADHTGWANLAEAALYQSRYPEAEAACRQAVALQPDNAIV